MMEQISRRDWERLSAYLDGQLSPKEQARLKARLSTDAALQSGWDDLRRTREALRSMPRLRAPRNFTLRPEMVAQPKRKPSLWYPAFRLASVMVSLLFVLVVVGDLLGLGGEVMAPSQELAAPAAKEVMEVVEEVEEVQQVEKEAEGDAVAGAPVPTAVAIEAAPEAEALSEPEAPAEAEAMVDEAAIEEPSEDAAANAAEEYTADAQRTEKETPALEVGAAPLATSTPSATAQPPTASPSPSVEATPTAEATVSPTVTPEKTPVYPSAFPWILGLEILLGVLTINMWLVVFCLRRRRRG